MSNAPSGFTAPKTNWTTTDPINPTDLNRIEGNANATETGNRTLDQALANPANVGTLRQILSWVAGRIRAITGTTNWWDAPATTLAAASAHHAAAAPHSGHETSTGAQARVDAHAVGTAVHGAVVAPTANLLVLRDANGRAQVAAPSVAADIARLDTVTAHTNLTNNPHGVTAAQVGAAPFTRRVARTSNIVLGAADSGWIIDITSGTFTQTFAAAATLGNGWSCYIRNSGTGDITLDPNAAETIDGLASFIMYPSECRLVTCDGVALFSVVLSSFEREYTASGTFVLPPRYASIAVEARGGGGGGGSGRRGGAATTRHGGGGGGGGGVKTVLFRASMLAANITITVGAGGIGGAAVGTDDTNGNAGGLGGVTSFGPYLVAYAGAGGAGGTTFAAPGGGGGGALTSGSGSSGGEPITMGDSGGGQFGGGFGSAGWPSGLGGGGGGASGDARNGGSSAFASGGGGAGGAATAGNQAETGGTGGGNAGFGGGGGSGGVGIAAAGAAGIESQGGGGGGGYGGAGGIGSRGGGGGGGGGANNGTANFGTGGTGGSGIVIVRGVV